MINEKLKTIVGICLISAIFLTGTLTIGSNSALGYGYGYGYGYGHGNNNGNGGKKDDNKGKKEENEPKKALESQNSRFKDVKITFAKDEFKKEGFKDGEVKINFKNIPNVSSYIISTKKDFKEAEWISAKKSFKAKVDEDKQKQTYYIKLKDVNGLESDVIKKTFRYEVPKRLVKDSKEKVSRGEILIQRGSGFTKNGKIALYFSKPEGSYYEPTIIKADANGKFKIDYKVNKPSGKYSWYAVDLTTGRKGEMSKYTIK